MFIANIHAEDVECSTFQVILLHINLYISHCRDVTKNETVGTTWIDLSQISNNNANGSVYLIIIWEMIFLWGKSFVKGFLLGV